MHEKLQIIPLTSWMKIYKVLQQRNKNINILGCVNTWLDVVIVHELDLIKFIFKNRNDAKANADIIINWTKS